MSEFKDKEFFQGIIKALDGVACVNLQEPTKDDLPRINNAYHETLKKLQAAEDRIKELEEALKLIEENLRMAKVIHEQLESFSRLTDFEAAGVKYSYELAVKALKSEGK